MDAWHIYSYQVYWDIRSVHTTLSLLLDSYIIRFQEVVSEQVLSISQAEAYFLCSSKLVMVINFFVPDINHSWLQLARSSVLFISSSVHIILHLEVSTNHPSKGKAFSFKAFVHGFIVYIWVSLTWHAYLWLNLLHQIKDAPKIVLQVWLIIFTILFLVSCFCLLHSKE